MKCDLRHPVAPASVPALQGLAVSRGTLTLDLSFGTAPSQRPLPKFFHFGLFVCFPLFDSLYL